jgi:protein-tyrosine phosphatase
MIDIHCHILPGFDDGPSDWDTAIDMCRIAAADGITHIVATPHVKEEVYRPSRQDIEAAVAELNRRIEGSHNLHILTGADVHFSADLAAQIRAGDIPLINGTNYFLLELPSTTIPVGLRQFVFDLRLMGVCPIVTHPERNSAIQEHEERLQELISGGALVQITAMSLTGEFGPAAMKSAERMLRLGFVHNISSDAHSTTVRPPVLSRAVERASQIVGEEAARSFVEGIPARIIAGQGIESAQRQKVAKSWFSFLKKRLWP